MTSLPVKISADTSCPVGDFMYITSHSGSVATSSHPVECLSVLQVI